MHLVWAAPLFGAILLAGCPLPGCAQRPIGTVATSDATVSNAEGGIVQASAGRASMSGSSTVTARDHTAAVALSRGGVVNVCRSTAVHLTAAADDSLLLALDRGAMEIRGKARLDDVVITPDMRFTLAEAGTLDLDIRVVMNGDTCIDNRGHKAPALKIIDAFGEATYELKPGQHVMFERGNLREVIDRETTPCGCPPDDKSMSLADAALASGSKGGAVTPEQAAVAHPFPVAVSEGLAEPGPPPAEPAGATHVQVGTTLAYDPNAPVKPDQPGNEAAPANPAADNPPAKKAGGSAFGAIGRFFKRLFVR